MIRKRQRDLGRIAAALFAIGVLTSTAAPAWAGDGDESAKSGDVCWVNADTGYSACYANETALHAAVLKQTGTVLVEEGSVAARGEVVALASYIVARLYDGASYTGTSMIVSSGSSTICVSGSVQAATMPAGWDNRVSSYHSYYGCQTRIHEDTNYNGLSQTAADDGSLGTLNNETSSYKVY